MPREVKLLEEILMFMDVFAVERGAQQQVCTFLIPAAFLNLILKLRLSAVPELSRLLEKVMRSQGSKLRIAQLAVVQDEPICGKKAGGYDWGK